MDTQNNVANTLKRIYAPRVITGDEQAALQRAITGCGLPTTQRHDGTYLNESAARIQGVWMAAVEWACKAAAREMDAETSSSNEGYSTYEAPTVEKMQSRMPFNLMVARADADEIGEWGAQQYEDGKRAALAEAIKTGTAFERTSVSITSERDVLLETEVLAGQDWRAPVGGQVDPSSALPSRTTAEWAASGCLTPEYMAEQARKNAAARTALDLASF